MAYVGARWPGLVRDLVEQGATPAQAHEVAAEALSRSRSQWAAESAGGDVDALVRREVAALWTPTWGAAGEVTVLAPPTLDELGDRQRDRRRRRARTTALVLAPVLLAVGGLAWWTTRPAEEQAERFPQAAVRPEVNPAAVPWYGDGAVHLREVSVTVDGVRSLVAAGDSVVWTDAQGRVVAADAAGVQEEIGQSEQPLVSDAGTGLVAWLAPDGTVTTWSPGDATTRTALVDGVREVVAVADDTVFFSDAVGTRAWQPGTQDEPSDVVEPADLVTAAGPTRVYAVGEGRLRIERPFAGVSFETAGDDAVVAADGELVLVHRAGGDRVLDTNTARRVEDGLDERFEVPVAASLGRDGTATYVVGRAEAETAPGFVRTGPADSVELRTCDLLTGACVSLLRFPAGDVPPLLAR